MLPRILFVYQAPSPFVLQDRDILRRHTEVIEFRWLDHPRPARALARMMARRRRSYDVIVAWFGDTHASTAFRVARWLRKPCILMIGGYDVSDVPGYGFLSSARNRRRAEGHFARATRVLAVSTALQGELVRRFPDTAMKTTVLPTGVDTDRFCPAGRKDPVVLSVAPIESWARALVKGWDRVVEVARHLPEVPFYLAGGSDEVYARLKAPSNVFSRGRVPHEATPALYQRSAVVLHPSRSEGFPNVLLEAMACGCVPVATPVGGVPELVGDAGILTSKNPPEIAEAVKRALASPEIGVRARERVRREFSIARRELGLVNVLSDIA